ncbi:glycosyltransferase family 4 protein [Exiguobacterium algae]|uniref:glycosyltransferase family 4 protein n=1 Tax=Exiguobacterium algae TaxID=2751250 RepID=UPI001BE658DB|nr:glycosyltransferase family 4 protein [Exiguobacterium algae]
MKILVVCQYYYPEPFRITDICESLVKNGHEVTVLTGLPNYPEGIVLDEYRYGNKRVEKINGVNVIRCFEIGRGKSNLRLFINYISFIISASIKSLSLKKKYDVVFVNQLSPVLMAIPGIIYKNKNRKKLLLYCLDLWPESLVAGGITEKSYIYKFFKIISKRIYNSADEIFISSNLFRDYFEEILNINDNNISYLPQYAENLFLENVEMDRNEKINFVFAGNIGDMQSVDTIVKAANEVKNNKDIVFHIVGDGSKLKECKNLTEKLNLKNIVYYGRLPLSKMPQIYGMADAMLITLKNNSNISYTLPGKLQSYMAAGKPIIGAINGEANQVIKESKCGLVCEAEDFSALAHLITNFHNSTSSEKLSMSKNSYSYYVNHFCKAHFMLKLEEKLCELGEN